jgi:predicted ATPase
MQRPKLIPVRQDGLAFKDNLPLQPTPLVGREDEVQAASTLLRRPGVRLLTLTGTPGIGKTRLALQVATELSGDVADGVHFVPLAPIRDPALVLTTITHAFGLRELGNQPAIELLTTYLRDRHLLLVLDNFEQVIAAAPLLAQLLEVCPELKLLVTSREVLHLRAEHQFPVPPLALPDLKRLPDSKSLPQYAAVNLFLQRARAVKPDFQLTPENAACIAEICARLDGLPLAIELAAARIKLLSPQALLARLDRRLQLLTGGAHDLPERQRTLRNTIEWSYELLHVEEQRLFRRLAAFVGGCQLSAAEALCRALGEEVPTVFEGITSLIDKSLLQQVEQEEDESRLLMLETIREYGLERLEASGEAEAMRRQHATFFLAMAEEAYPKAHSAEQSTWLRRLEADHDNLRAALRWTLERQEAQMGLRLGGALHTFWKACNHDSEGRSWLAQVLAQPGAKARTIARAKALRGLGLLAFTQGDFPEAHRLLEESVSVGREMGAAGKFDLANALHRLAQVALLQGNPPVRAPTSRKPCQSHGRRGTSNTPPTRWPIWEPSPCAWVRITSPSRSTSRALRSTGNRATSMVSSRTWQGWRKWPACSDSRSKQHGCLGQSRDCARRAASRCRLCVALNMTGPWRASAPN